MRLRVEPYFQQREHWPRSGRHILAQFDVDTVVVYQAYRPEIAAYATEHGQFGGPFSFSRMSWIKPNFLWMMYRCGWASKEGQERVLAIHLQRPAFEEILGQAVPSTFEEERGISQKEWQRQVARSNVRLQWDPDHSPSGGKLARRAIQLGLRGEALAHYAREWIMAIEDITPFVHAQKRNLAAGDHSHLETPSEEVYPLSGRLAAVLGSD